MTELKRPSDFIVIKTWSKNSVGTTHEYHQLVRCPDCHYEFVRDVSEGCFHSTKEPWACPNCNYPWSYLQEAQDKIIKKKKKEPVFNPSQRLT